jgi:hypothetical protein
MTVDAIEVRIEELALTGFGERDRDRVGEALRVELTRLLTHAGPPAPRSGDVLSLSYDADPGASPERIGRAAARSIARGLR